MRMIILVLLIALMLIVLSGCSPLTPRPFAGNVANPPPNPTTASPVIAGLPHLVTLGVLAVVGGVVMMFVVPGKLATATGLGGATMVVASLMIGLLYEWVAWIALIVTILAAVAGVIMWIKNKEKQI